MSIGSLPGEVTETLQWTRDSPLVWLFATLVAYRFSVWLHGRMGARPLGQALTQPVLVTVLLVGGVLLACEVDYADYRADTELIAFLLGPATVAFAIPLHRNMGALKSMVAPMLIALVAGASAAVASGYALVRLLGGDDALAATMAAKTATTPVAITVSEVSGGIGPLSAVFAVLAGILGAVAAPAVLTALRVCDPRARGLAMGVVSHGVGTSRSLRDDPLEGAVAGMATGLTALTVSLITPAVLLLMR